MTYDDVLPGLSPTEYRLTAEVAVALEYDGDLAVLRRMLDELTLMQRVRKLAGTERQPPRYKLSAWR